MSINVHVHVYDFTHEDPHIGYDAIASDVVAAAGGVVVVVRCCYCCCFGPLLNWSDLA